MPCTLSTQPLSCGLVKNQSLPAKSKPVFIMVVVFVHCACSVQFSQTLLVCCDSGIREQSSFFVWLVLYITTYLPPCIFLHLSSSTCLPLLVFLYTIPPTTPFPLLPLPSFLLFLVPRKKKKQHHHQQQPALDMVISGPKFASVSVCKLVVNLIDGYKHGIGGILHYIECSRICDTTAI